MSIKIIAGDCREALHELPEESVHCVVTSPPYWGLRDYGTEPQIWGNGIAMESHGQSIVCEHEWGDIGPVHHPGQVPDGKAVHAENAIGQNAGSGQFCTRCNAWRGNLGQEPTLDLHIQHIVEIFREVRRALRKDGTVWFNYGDCYHNLRTHMSGGQPKQGFHNERHGQPESGGVNRATPQVGLKEKDLCMMPARVALALQADGWWIRSEIVWSKPNPMPESCTDRPTSAHEKVYLLTKAPRYFFDAEAVREDGKGRIDRWPGSHGRIGEQGWTGNDQPNVAGRNIRNVWTIATAPFPGAHFATFPPALVERCIKAGTSEKGCCPECGAPGVRGVEKRDTGNTQKKGDGWATHEGGHGSFHRDGREQGEPQQPILETVTTGWHPSCNCGLVAVPCTVLDPFGGSGTVGLVADRLGRDAILIDLSSEYVTMAHERIQADAGMFAEMNITA